MMDDDLIRIKTLLAAGKAIPEDLASWLILGIDLFNSGHCKTLCLALGLRRPGLSSPLTRNKIELRNACIVNWSKMYPGTPWRQAYMIADKIKHYPRINAEEKSLYGYLAALEIKNKLPCRTTIFKILKMTSIN